MIKKGNRKFWQIEKAQKKILFQNFVSILIVMGKNKAPITVSHSKKPKTISTSDQTVDKSKPEILNMEMSKTEDNKSDNSLKETQRSHDGLEKPSKKQKLNKNDQSSSSSVSKPSFKDAVSYLEWLIHPVTVDDFFANYWEIKPLHISRTQKDPNYYSHLFSIHEFLNLVKHGKIDLGRNLNIINYEKSEGTFVY
jgi:hypothetical protein